MDHRCAGSAGRALITNRGKGWVMRIVLALLLLGGFTTGGVAQTIKSGDNLSISVLQDPKLDRQVIVRARATRRAATERVRAAR